MTTNTMELSKISVSPLPAVEISAKDEQGILAAQFSPAQQLFFRQLHNMLTYESSNANGCVKWLDDSVGFAITDKDVFSERILKRHFGEAKYASFTRRLKRWGFKRITKGANSGAYYHDAFHRGMNFDDFDDDLGSMAPSDSSQSLPPKKRMAWSPAPSNEHHSANTFNSMHNQNADVNIMPDIMRQINRIKRCERNEYDLPERNEYDLPAAKRSKFDNSYFYGESTGACMPRNHAFSSFGNYYRNQEAPQDHFEYLSRLKRQVYEENQGAFDMNHANGRSNFKNSMHSLSNVSTDILKREIDLRRMQQRFAYQNNSNNTHHQSPFNGYNMNMSNDMSDAPRFSSSMKYSNHFNDRRSPSDEYAARALGSLKGPTDISGMPYMQQKGWGQMKAFNGSANNTMNNKNHDFNHTFDSGNNKVPIPGITDEMEPRKNPFNRAA